MYSKVFASMYDGTLATKGPWQALVTFQQLLILANKFGIVDMTAEAISRRTTIPLEIIEIGIPALEEIDQDSRSPNEDGRRIMRLDPIRKWGWQIVNYEKYAKIKSEEDRKDYQRRYMRNWRAQRKQPLADVNNVKSVSLLDPILLSSHLNQDKIAPSGAKEDSKEKSPRPKDEVWEAMLGACGIPYTATIPKSARGAYNRACRELKELTATAASIEAHARAFRTRWPTVSLTPTALVRRWNECVSQNRSIQHEMS